MMKIYIFSKRGLSLLSALLLIVFSHLTLQAQEISRAFNVTAEGEPFTYLPILSSSSDPTFLTTEAQLNGVLFVRGETDDTGSELYKFDRSSGTVSLVDDLEIGQEGSDPRGLTVVEDVLLFHAETADNGRELYRTDGTKAGTRMFDLVPGTASAFDFSFSVSDMIFGVYQNLGFISLRYSSGGFISSKLAVYDSRADSLMFYPMIRSPRQVIRVDSNFYVVTSGGAIHKVMLDGTSEFITQGPFGWYRRFEDKLMVSGNRVVGFVDLATGVIDSIYTNPNIPSLNDTLTFRTEDALYFFNSHDSFGLGELWRTDGTANGTVCLDIGPGSSGPVFYSDFIATKDGLFTSERVFPNFVLRKLDTLTDEIIPVQLSVDIGSQLIAPWNGAVFFGASAGGGLLSEHLEGRTNTRAVGSRVGTTDFLREVIPVGDYLIANALGDSEIRHVINYLDCDDAVNSANVEVCAGESIVAFGRTVNATDTFIVNTPVYRGCDTVTTVTVSVLDTVAIAVQGPDSITIGDSGMFVSSNGEVTWPDGSTSVSFEFTTDSLSIPGTASILVTATDPLTGCASEQSVEVVLVMPISSTTDISNQFRIAPNPASTQVNLMGYRQGDRWTLISADGRKIAQGNQEEVDVSTLPRGLYWIRIQRASGVGIRTVMLK